MSTAEFASRGLCCRTDSLAAVRIALEELMPDQWREKSKDVPWQRGFGLKALLWLTGDQYNQRFY